MTQVAWIRDIGPPKPTPPASPSLPQGAHGSPEFILAMVEFWPTMEAHAKAVDAYTQAKYAYDDWHSRFGDALDIPMDPLTAKEAMANDARAVKEGRQASLRYYPSPRS
jgi:hypothetical protein